MFDIVEKHRGFFKILLILIALSFVTFTAHSFSQAGGDYIAKVDGQMITQQDVDRVIRANQMQPNVQVQQEAYELLLNQAYFVSGARSLGVSANQEKLKNIIMNEKMFHENGAFSQKKFNDFLQGINMSESMFLDNLRKDVYVQSVSSLFNENVPIADVQVEQMAKIVGATRKVQLATFKDEDYIEKVIVNDADIEKFYSENQERYKKPLAVKFDYIKVAASDLADKQTVSDEEMQTALSKLNIKDKETDTAIKEDLLNQLKLEKAKRALSIMKDNLAEAAFNESKNLDAAAKVAGVSVNHQTQWVAKGELEFIGLPEKLSDELFIDDVLRQGNNSDVIDIDGALWVVRVVEVREEEAPNLNDIKETIAKDLHLQKARQLAQEDAQNILDKLQKGENVEVKWQAEMPFVLEQLDIELPDDLKQVLYAKPEEGKPVFLIFNSMPVVTLMRVNSIEEKTFSEQEKVMLRMQLAQKNAASNVGDYYRYLQRTVKLQNGHQKIGGE
ncbi:MAG: SurA N-terminal domain-containing protein [Neisseriaceae bacterium]|nr:SurA N-terminal domain-containing protein [Neisseriaceae bacterium]